MSQMSRGKKKIEMIKYGTKDLECGVVLKWTTELTWDVDGFCRS